MIRAAAQGGGARAVPREGRDPGRRPGSTGWLLLALAVAMGSQTPARPVVAETISEGRGCQGSTWIVTEPSLGVPFPLDLSVPGTLARGLIDHRCPGPVYVRGTAVANLLPTATDDAAIFVRSRATCLGGGCPVTGVPIAAAPGSTTVLFELKGSPGIAFSLVPVIGVFPDLPPGTYKLDILGLGVNGEGIGAAVYVLDGGGAAGADRPPS